MSLWLIEIDNQYVNKNINKPRSSAAAVRPRDAKSLKVVENGTIWKLGHGFLFAFHSNYGLILYNLWDKARYWSKIAIFFIPYLHLTPPLGGLHRNIAITFSMKQEAVLSQRGRAMLRVCIASIQIVKRSLLLLVFSCFGFRYTTAYN